MDTSEICNIWQKAKDILFSKIEESDYPWIKALEPAGYSGGIFTVITEKNFAVTIVRNKYLKEIKESLKQVIGNEVDFEVIVDEAAIKEINKQRKRKNPIVVSKQNGEQDVKNPMDHLTKMQSTNLNLKYKFENFVVGENSRRAYSVAKMVAEHPAEKYNPLFIYGGSGLGKTHLMQAIGHSLIFNLGIKEIRYIKAQDIINQYMNNMREDNKTALMSKFRQKYKNYKVLLIDDIQFIEGKKRFMDELFDIFDSLLQSNKQIVLTSDRLPRDIPKIPDRLRTRFEMGIVVDIEPPPLETRIEILKKWCSDLRLDIKGDILEFIAQNFSNNVRELEGAFNKVTAIADIENADITMDFVKNVLKVDTKLKKISIDTIANVVAEYYSVSLDSLRSPSKNQNLSDARKYITYLSRELTNLTYEDIAKFLNKRYPTMMYSYQKITEALDRDATVKETLRELKQAINLALTCS